LTDLGVHPDADFNLLFVPKGIPYDDIDPSTSIEIIYYEIYVENIGVLTPNPPSTNPSPPRNSQ
jgi:hypothetical protein